MVTPLLTNQSWGLRKKAARSIVTIADKLGKLVLCTKQYLNINARLNRKIDKSLMIFL